MLGRNPAVPPGFHNTSIQPVRGVRSSYSQRSSPAFRAPSSNARVGHVGSADEGLHLIAETYSSRPSRPLPNIACRHGDRSGRLRISNDRYRTSADEPSLHDRFPSDVCNSVQGIFLLAVSERWLGLLFKTWKD